MIFPIGLAYNEFIKLQTATLLPTTQGANATC